MFIFFFFFNDPATTEIYTLSHTTLFRSTFTVRVVVSRVAVNSASLAFTRLADTSRLTATAYDEIGRAQSELQSRSDLVCRLLLEKKNEYINRKRIPTVA